MPTGQETQLAREIQESQYEFPYHHVPRALPDCDLIAMVVAWGMEYLAILETVIAMIGETEPESILDFGCGDGRLLVEVAQLQRASRHVGVDFSARALAFGRAFGHGIPNLEFCESLDQADGTFDVIVAMEVLEHIPDEDQAQVYASLAAKLAPNGRFLISVPTNNRPVDEKHFRHYDETVLATEVAPHFVIQKVSYIHKLGSWTTFLRHLRCNPLGLLRFKPLTRWISRSYRRHCRPAQADNGAHLLACLTRSDSA